MLVLALLSGPQALVALRLALDTGATRTVLSRRVLEKAGFDLTLAAGTFSIATGSQLETLSLHRVDSLFALGQVRDGMETLVHDLPASPRIDGVLGLDFLRNCRLTLDFARGELELVQNAP